MLELQATLLAVEGSHQVAAEAVHLVAAAVQAVEASEVEDKTNKQRKEYYE